MTLYIDSDKKIASQEDALALLIGEIVLAVKDNGTKFASKLIEVRGEGANQELWFSNRNGQVWMIRRSAIKAISKMMPRRP